MNTQELAYKIADQELEIGVMQKTISQYRKLIKEGFGCEKGVDKIVKLEKEQDSDKIIGFFDVLASYIKTLEDLGFGASLKDYLASRHKIKIDVDNTKEYLSDIKKYNILFNEMFYEAPSSPENDYKKIISALRQSHKDVGEEKDNLKQEILEALPTISEGELALKTAIKVIKDSKKRELPIEEIIGEYGDTLFQQEKGLGLLSDD